MKTNKKLATKIIYKNCSSINRWIMQKNKIKNTLLKLWILEYKQHIMCIEINGYYSYTKVDPISFWLSLSMIQCIHITLKKKKNYILFYIQGDHCRGINIKKPAEAIAQTFSCHLPSTIASYKMDIISRQKTCRPMWLVLNW